MNLMRNGDDDWRHGATIANSTLREIWVIASKICVKMRTVVDSRAVRSVPSPYGPPESNHATDANERLARMIRRLVPGSGRRFVLFILSYFNTDFSGDYADFAERRTTAG